jgi:hypothetical protein
MMERLRGLIRRRILVNFRVDPDVMQRHLPRGFEPELVNGHGIAGICLIRLEREGPSWMPFGLGLSSENAAHRYAARRRRGNGVDELSVFIARRDSSSLFTALFGGRAFPGEHARARFDVRDEGDAIDLKMEAADGLRVELRARTARSLPAGSTFGSLEVASGFVRNGALGYSATRAGTRLDAMCLAANDWALTPLRVDSIDSTYFEDRRRFPSGSVELDSAVLMRDIEHEWRSADGIEL